MYWMDKNTTLKLLHVMAVQKKCLKTPVHCEHILMHQWVQRFVNSGPYQRFTHGVARTNGENALSSCQRFKTLPSSSRTPHYCLSSNCPYKNLLSLSPSLSLSLHAIIPISVYFISPIMALIIRFQHVLSFILWLFLFIILFHGWFGFNSNNDNAVTSSSQLQLSVSRNRKLLATGGFDFTPFLRRHHRHHHRHRHHHHRTHMPEPKETEIDPRYGVEKRLVPTGPNPLHH
ncbi:hypothetical protein VNO77_24392 [Canavalia gladiata]|uniref:Uncharacterized protein n=1 Tax=Canavalia gladiata TaxID=3824 RepID=A0AAN9L674_CANGL